MKLSFLTDLKLKGKAISQTRKNPTNHLYFAPDFLSRME